jgi:hypothetical protein
MIKFGVALLRRLQHGYRLKVDEKYLSSRDAILNKDRIDLRVVESLIEFTY